MKKFIYFSICIGLLPFIARSQLIPNASFENWSTITYFEDLDSYLTTNFQAYFSMGAANVTKSTDAHSGTYSAKLETVSSPGGLIQGGIIIGNAGPGGFSGGISFTQHPYTISLWTKYNIPTGDSAIIIFLFKKLGNNIGVVVRKPSGQQLTYQHMIMPVTWMDSTTMPDTVAMAVFSSNPSSPTGLGSLMWLDDINFVGVTAQLPNNSFENWTSLYSEEPDLWKTSNPYTFAGGGLSVTKSTDHYDGSFSAKLTTKVTPNNGDTVAYMTDGIIGNNGPQGGTPVPYNPAKFSFYYKYFPNGLDSALAGGWLYRYDAALDSTIVLEQELHKLPAASTWTLHEVQFFYSSWPPADTLNISFASSNIQDPGAYVGLGSSLYVDKVQLFIQPVGIGETHNVSLEPVVFPNPATDKLIVNSGNDTKNLIIEILDLQGQKIQEFSFNPNSSKGIDISFLSKGTYLYRIKSVNSQLNGKFIKM